MAHRIRSIKPEFWESESNGRLSRDARLLFIALISFADDEGRFRASSRGLASALFPFDEDARGLIDAWLAELEAAGKIRRWIVDGDTYGDIPKYSEHQKIDRPSKSRLPAFVESSRVLANAREASCEDGKGLDGKGLDLCGSPKLPAPAALELIPTEPPRPTPPERPPATPPERKRVDTDDLCDDFAEITGKRYRWQGAKDGVAYAELRKLATHDEIRKRWRLGLKLTGYEHVATVAQLLAKWNDIGAHSPVKNRDWRSLQETARPGEENVF